jgi:hypothetical protein
MNIRSTRQAITLTPNFATSAVTGWFWGPQSGVATANL